MMKTCFKCGEIKPIDAFHHHSRMKDGHLNKCGSCAVRDVAAWRKKHPGGSALLRRREYERALASGSRTRKAPKKFGRDPIARKAASLRYMHKRRLQTANTTELDDFAFDEAIRLRDARAKVTGIRWSLDHIVPLNYRTASGLHNAFNFQVVPLRWNELKRNTSMEAYWPARY